MAVPMAIGPQGYRYLYPAQLGLGARARTLAALHREAQARRPVGEVETQSQESDEEHLAEQHEHAFTFARWEEKMGPKAPRGAESQSYEMYNSEHYVEHLKKNGRLADNVRKCGEFLPGVMRWLFLCLIGLGSGLVAVCVDTAIDYVYETRMGLNDHVYETDVRVWKQYLCWAAASVALASVAAFLVCYVEVLAAGSGIPEIKRYLNGVDFPSVVGLHTLMAKAFGIVFSVSAGLPCGKEGPMIHSGAIIGAVVAGLRIDTLIKPFIRTQEVRDLVAAGAAAGVAGAFGAPLGSVLFAIEEGTSHMNPFIMMRLFAAASVSTLVSRLFMGRDHGLPWGLLGWRVPVSFGRFSNMDYYILEFGIFGLMAVCGGLMGALFNCMNKRLTLWRQRHIGPRGHKRFLEALFVTFVIASFNFWVVILLSDGPYMLEELPDDIAIFWRTGTKAMKQLFHGQEDFDLRYLLLFAVMNFIFTCWNYGVGVPSGLFVPSLLTGSAFGRIIGQLVNNHLNSEDSPIEARPGTYALIGACAMLAGTARITISLAMILMETMGEAEFGLPIFLAVMVAKLTGDVFNRGIYDLHIIELKHVPFLETLPEGEMIELQVRDVMQRKVITLDLVVKVSRLVQVLSETNHHAFPVLYPGTRRMAGLLSQQILRRLLELGEPHGLFLSEGEEAPAKHISWSMMTSAQPFMCKTPLEYQDLVADHMDKVIHLTPYINRSCLFVLKYTSVYVCYQMFRQLGLRHLAVLGMDGCLAGIITRKDLILAEEGQQDMAKAMEESDTDGQGSEDDQDCLRRHCSHCPEASLPDAELGRQHSSQSAYSTRSQGSLFQSSRVLEAAEGGMGGAGGM